MKVDSLAEAAASGVARAARSLAAAALLLGLGACSTPPRTIWTKEGVGQEQTRADQRDCLREADNFNFLVQNPADQSGVGANAATDRQVDVYRICMQQRGYSQELVPPKQGQGQNQD